MSVKKSAGRKNACESLCELEPSHCPLWNFVDEVELVELDDTLRGSAKQFACGAVQRALQSMETYYTRDQLTGLYTRAYTKNVIASRIRYMMAEFTSDDNKATGIQLAFLDLDGFKAVNDHLGHAAGDDVLRIVADKLRSITRDHDLVSRWGGDEFLIVAPYIPRSYIQFENVETDFGQRLIEGVTFTYASKFPITASVGIARVELKDGDIDEDTIDVIVDHADKEMYKAKQNGKGQACESLLVI